jgi:hypothetical protein
MAELLAADALDVMPVAPAKATQAVIKIRDFKFVISVRLLWFPPIEGTRVRTLVSDAPITVSARPARSAFESFLPGGRSWRTRKNDCS